MKHPVGPYLIHTGLTESKLQEILYEIFIDADSEQYEEFLITAADTRAVFIQVQIKTSDGSNKLYTVKDHYFSSEIQDKPAPDAIDYIRQTLMMIREALLIKGIEGLEFSEDSI